MKQLLSDYGLESFQDKRPSELSGGQRTKVLLGKLLLEKPDILLLEAGPGRYPRNFQADILLIAKDVSELRGNTDGMMRKNGIAVFDPARFEDISFLRTEQLTAVTCGINEKNTISVSSIHDDSIILTLFRELKGVFGQKLEMQESLYENIPPVQDVYTAILACEFLDIAKTLFEEET